MDFKLSNSFFPNKFEPLEFVKQWFLLTELLWNILNNQKLNTNTI